MNDYLIDNVEDVVTLINNQMVSYQENRDYHDEQGNKNMAISYQGSVVGLAYILTFITGKEYSECLRNADEIFKPIIDVCNKYNIKLEDLHEVLEEYILNDNEGWSD